MKSLTGAAAGLAVALLLSVPAFAQNTGGATGSSSGPAAGGNVAPSTAVQKQNQTGQMGAGQHGASGQAAGGAMGAGAPGVAAKPGAEGGPAPKSGAGMKHPSD